MVVVGGIVECGELPAECVVQLVVERRLRFGALDETGQDERPGFFRCLEQSDRVSVGQQQDRRDMSSGCLQMRRKPCLPKDFARIAAVVAVQREDVAGVAGGGS
jgi:hypothetical protein